MGGETMNKTKYCIVYGYKGASTDWHTERFNRFVEDDEELAEFIQKCKDNPSQYMINSVFICSFGHLSDSYVESIIHRYKQQEELNQREEEFKVKSARDKLNRNLNPDEQRILGIDFSLE